MSNYSLYALIISKVIMTASFILSSTELHHNTSEIQSLDESLSQFLPLMNHYELNCYKTITETYRVHT